MFQELWLQVASSLLFCSLCNNCKGNVVPPVACAEYEGVYVYVSWMYMSYSWLNALDENPAFEQMST